VLDQFNSGEATGLATLYLDGQPAGAISRRRQTFTWDLDRAAIMPGLGYVGLIDDLAIFGRAFTASEVAELHALPAGVSKLK
jgi:hypothetical protein